MIFADYASVAISHGDKGKLIALAWGLGDSAHKLLVALDLRGRFPKWNNLFFGQAATRIINMGGER